MNMISITCEEFVDSMLLQSVGKVLIHFKRLLWRAGTVKAKKSGRVEEPYYWSPLPPPAGLVGNATGFPFSPLFRSQTYPKPIFVRFVFLRCFCFVLACFWDAFGIHFGRPNRPNLGQVAPKTAFGTIFLQQHECSRNIGRRSVWSVSRAPREHPKRPKIGPRRPQANLKE